MPQFCTLNSWATSTRRRHHSTYAAGIGRLVVEAASVFCSRRRSRAVHSIVAIASVGRAPNFGPDAQVAIVSASAAGRDNV
jgi:hypothetical protein